MTTTKSIGAILLCVLTACAAQLSPTGGNGGGSGGGGGSSMTATQFLTQMEMKYCDEAFTCQASFPTDAGVTFADAFGASASVCYSDGAAYDMPASVETEITAGKIHYDAAAAASCVAGITYASCSDFWTNGGNYPASCDTALVGTVANGGACVVDYDCSSADSVCDPTAHTCGPVPQGSGA